MIWQPPATDAVQVRLVAVAGSVRALLAMFATLGKKAMANAVHNSRANNAPMTRNICMDKPYFVRDKLINVVCNVRLSSNSGYIYRVISMQAELKRLNGDVAGRREAIADYSETSPKGLHYRYRPDEKHRPVVFDVLDSAIGFLGVSWFQFGLLVEAPDNVSCWRWKIGKHTPSYKYLVKALGLVAQEGFRRDRAVHDLLVPVRRLVTAQLVAEPKDSQLKVPDHPRYPVELRGLWTKLGIGDQWHNKRQGKVNPSSAFVSHDLVLKLASEKVAPNST